MPMDRSARRQRAGCSRVAGPDLQGRRWHAMAPLRNPSPPTGAHVPKKNAQCTGSVPFGRSATNPVSALPTGFRQNTCRYHPLHSRRAEHRSLRSLRDPHAASGRTKPPSPTLPAQIRYPPTPGEPTARAARPPYGTSKVDLHAKPDDCRGAKRARGQHGNRNSGVAGNPDRHTGRDHDNDHEHQKKRQWYRFHVRASCPQYGALRPAGEDGVFPAEGSRLRGIWKMFCICSSVKS